MKDTTFFKHKLTEGKKVEEAVVKVLQRLLPGYEVINTVQDDRVQRYKYSLIDVVVMQGEHICFGIECKRSEVKYEACLNRCGWDGDYNTPLNHSSLMAYKDAYFPVWIININEFCHKAFAAPLDVVLKSPNDAGMNVKRSGEVIYNNDSRGWNRYEGEFTLADILEDIIKKEL